MSRIIKFRAWDTERKMFVPQGEIIFRDYGDTEIEVYPNDQSYIGDSVHNGEPQRGRFIVMQYTGLEDSKGVEIYEGDIILCEAYQREIYDVIEFGEKLVVEFKDGYFYPFGYNCGWRSGVHSMEVIGNIYESPELLQGETKK